MRVFWMFALFFLLNTPAYGVQSYADVVEDVMPSVVNISIERQTVSTDENIDNLMVEPNLDGRESLGTGFFIRNDGYILTNYHIIKGAKSILAITSDGVQYDAKLIGTDKPSDLAVLKIAKKKDETFKAVVFGNADKARIGDVVLTFGNPYGLGISVSQGIISAKSRHIGLGEQQYIQTDAAINQGNSGGPMINLEGQVIGINSAIFTTKGANGVGFALPSNIANWIASQLVSSGKVQRGGIGFRVSNGMDQYTSKSGFVITEIDEESSAYKEGLRVGDVIITYNDRLAQNLDDFILFTETMEPNQALRLKALTSGEENRYVVRIQEIPAETLASVTNKALSEYNRYYHQDLGKDVFYISELNIAVKEVSPRGLSIVKLEKKSPLYDKGVKEGDIILEADGSDIYSSDNLLDSIRNAFVDDYRPISLLIQGVDNSYYVSVKVEAEND